MDDTVLKFFLGFVIMIVLVALCAAFFAIAGEYAGPIIFFGFFGTIISYMIGDTVLRHLNLV